MQMPEFLEKKYIGPLKGWHIVAIGIAGIAFLMWRKKSSSKTQNPAATCPPGSTMDPTGTFCIPDASQAVGGGIPIGSGPGGTNTTPNPYPPIDVNTAQHVSPNPLTQPQPQPLANTASAFSLPQGFSPFPLSLSHTGTVQQATYYNSQPAQGYAPATMNIDLIQRLQKAGLSPDQIAAFGGLTPGAHSSLNYGYQASTVPSYGTGTQYPTSTPYAPAFLQGQ